MENSGLTVAARGRRERPPDWKATWSGQHLGRAARRLRLGQPSSPRLDVWQVLPIGTPRTPRKSIEGQLLHVLAVSRPRPTYLTTPGAPLCTPHPALDSSGDPREAGPPQHGRTGSQRYPRGSECYSAARDSVAPTTRSGSVRILTVFSRSFPILLSQHRQHFSINRVARRVGMIFKSGYPMNSNRVARRAIF